MDHFDHLFGNSGTITHGNSNTTFSTVPNPIGGEDFRVDGKTVATSRENVLGGMTTYESGEKVSSRQLGVSGNEVIKNAKEQVIGEIKTDVLGQKNLYVENELLATKTIDAIGNQKIIQHKDPLSVSEQYAMRELVFSRL